MDAKKTLIAVVLLLALLNVGFVFAANESYRNVYSAFGLEDPDPDLDGVYGKDDECPGSAFNMAVITKDTSKKKSVTTFADPVNAGKKIYLRVSAVSKKSVTFQTASNEKFTGEIKTFTAAPNKIAAIASIQKGARVIYL